MSLGLQLSLTTAGQKLWRQFIGNQCIHSFQNSLRLMEAERLSLKRYC